MRPSTLAVLAAIAVTSWAGTSAAQDAPSSQPAATGTPPPASTTPPKQAEPRDEVLFGAGVHQGGYAAPEVKITSFTGDAALLAGGQAGWIIDRSLVLGLAGYGLATAHSPVPELSSPIGTSRIGFGYGGVRLAYVFTPQRLVHLSTGALVGAGGVTAVTSERVFDAEDGDTDQRWRAHHGGAFFVAEPTADVEINLHKYVRVALSGSYRFASSTDRPGFKSSDLSGPAAGLAFKFGMF
jgi:hypothetical protein